MTRVLAIWLDGFDMALADRWNLPSLGALAEEGAWAHLDNGTAHLSGLSGEHLVTGLGPDDAGRASAVTFDPATYECRQDGFLVAPALGAVPTVVFDPCYLDLDACPPTVTGITDWGAHDPGGPPQERPDGVRSELHARFGTYPAAPWVYATPWASPARCEAMGRDLVEAVDRRAQIATWLLGERLPDWRLALIGVSEPHSATEGLFHGVDPEHPLHAHASAPSAARSLRAVYDAADRLVGSLLGAFPDAVHVVFSLHGMGRNTSDVTTMALLGELLARWSGQRTPDTDFALDAHGVAVLGEDESWSTAVSTALTPPSEHRRPPVSAVRRAARHLPDPLRSALRRLRGARPAPGLEWMPLLRHQPRWPEMAAFALPSFYDGRVRINVRGREGQGRVDPGDYDQVLSEVEELLRGCRDPRTGGPAVGAMHRTAADPFAVGVTDADLVVDWADGVYGLDHPELGTIGPLPPRRTGGHTSPLGRLLVHGDGIDPGDLGTRSSFDVLPTLLDLSGAAPPHRLTGRALRVPRIGEPAP
ncbi:hypothetical protein [Rhabdothermincola salaria]|uniref:hypothetical protein n=1 Tax=Rhabdothermincola salaria TaxID=2903142 RepID=UPI001E5053D2|nr:hypothetical protein [Rhabdothermincola salaria]MCD9623285.1 hypothetical protein [Rhabdothermincola salaria]